MHSTLKLRESDPHDDFSIAPEIVPATWADKVVADIARDAGGAAAPTIDTTFRATHAGDSEAANDQPAGPTSTGSWAKSAITVFLFGLCSALAAAGWQHYGTDAKQMISAWIPPLALTSSPPPEPTGLTAQSDTPDAGAAGAIDQAPPQPASAQPAESAASVAAAPSPDAAQLQSMARDLAAMGQEVQLLKATIAELKSGQQTMARDTAKPADAKPAETKPSEVRAAVPNPRPKISPPPRPATVAARRPIAAYPAYSPVQSTPPSPQIAPPPASFQPVPPPPATVESDGGPVIRPPMPLH